MVLQALKEIVAPRPNTLYLKVGSARIVELPASEWNVGEFRDPARNIAQAFEDGIRPVNLHDLRQQFSDTQLQESVLFDTPPRGGMGIGNHWRILSIDDESKSAHIQLTGNFGNHDMHIPPFHVSQYDVLFTGITTLNYIRNGNRLTLAQVIESFKQVEKTKESLKTPEDVHFESDTIYFADKDGKLLRYDQHPMFASEAV